MDWTEEAIGRLRALWAEGLSTAEIGRRMGISKNAVVGKAHRLNLSARPSPIRRVPGGAPARAATPRQAPRPFVRAPAFAPTFAPAFAPAASSFGGNTYAFPQPAPRPAPAPPAPRPVAPPAPRPAPRLSNSACCWPIGEPGKAGFRFCGSAALAAKPYCEEHAALAYVRAKPRQEDAA